MLKRAPFLLSFVLVASQYDVTAYASDFGPYSSLSHEVSVSYAKTKRNQWTWKFLNNSDTTTITYMAFRYVDKSGSHDDFLPGKLAPGTAFGGWGAYSASSRPTITIKKIKREVI